ncbi:MAG: cyclodeaminase/cyclohydrolase family protein [Anaerovoracaceae bacterium]|nr:cyclodeaminase/cyclohydrolase family protein [Bacillota bacterium]MDY2671405.1 cyclodeaminase/cyclohydrolase family protein [Anaerovoracaceae bacterium]
MLSKSCTEFLSELGSSAPVPGGGSASALVAALGAALGTMVGELSKDKKSTVGHEEEMSELIKRSKELTEKAKDAVMRDVTAFEPLAAAYRLPSGTEDEKAARTEAIQSGLIPAAEAPLQLAELCAEALEVLNGYSKIGNRLAVSDAGTGAAMLEAALKGARLNVLINLRSMKDEEKKAGFAERLDKAYTEGMKLAEEAYVRVEQACI